MFDARRLSAEGQEDLRRRVVAAVDAGMSQLQAARVFGVSRRAVGEWTRVYRATGPEALRAQRRGRPPGQQSLSRRTQAELLEELAAGTPAPDEGSALWSRRAVAELIETRTGLRLSPTTVSQYLLRWGIGPLPAPVGHPAALLRQRGATDERAGAATLQVAWTRPVPRYLDTGLLPGPGSFAAGPLPGRIGPPPDHLEVLMAQSARGDMLFLAARDPWRPCGVIEFARRLQGNFGHPVQLVVRAWPSGEGATLRGWAADPGPDVHITIV
ncbi:MAG TPA: helix-turn-helix domain-containing protein [Sporichthyaceae bacterium]|jgi:transposase|nr:helix-turn-helix domain-containing protein [Sporichthyaceae bacterium]